MRSLAELTASSPIARAFRRRRTTTTQISEQSTPQLDLTSAATRLIRQSPLTTDLIDTSGTSTPLFDDMHFPTMPGEEQPIRRSSPIINSNVFGSSLHPRPGSQEIHEATADERFNTRFRLMEAAFRGYTLAVPFEEVIVEKEEGEIKYAEIVRMGMMEQLYGIAQQQEPLPNFSFPLEVPTDSNRQQPPSLEEQQMQYIGHRLGELGRPKKPFVDFTLVLLSDPRVIPHVTKIVSQSQTLGEVGLALRKLGRHPETEEK